MEQRLTDEKKVQTPEGTSEKEVSSENEPKRGKKQANFVKKRLVAVVVAISILLVSLSVFLVVRHVRSNRPPELATIRDRVIALIGASEEINQVFWGEGLPTYPRYYEQYHTRVPFYLVKNENGYTVSSEKTAIKLFYHILNDAEQGEIIAYQYCFSESKDGNLEDIVYIDVQKGEQTTSKERNLLRYARKTTTREEEEPLYEKGGVYYYQTTYQEPEHTYTYSDPEYYDFVRFDCKYGSTTQIKMGAELVYAKSFLNSVYESMFTGIQVSENTGGILYARYMDHTDTEGNTYLMKSNQWKAVDVSRVYLFDTMRMSETRKSNSTDVYLDIDTYVPENPQSIQTVTVSITLEDGNWFLNSATY